MRSRIYSFYLSFLLIVLVAVPCISSAQTFNGSITNTAGNSQIPSVNTGGCGIEPQTAATGGTRFNCAVAGVTPGSNLRSVNINFNHTFDGDIDMFLISPAGAVLELSTDNGGGGDNFTNTEFRDDALTNITAGAPPYTGQFRPEGTLTPTTCGITVTPTVTTVAGMGINSGTWQLLILDDAGGDTGPMLSWSLVFVNTTGPCAASAPTVFSNNTPAAISDLATTTSTITVSGAGTYLYDLNLITAITHTFPGDLDMTLTSPAGTVITISSDNGGSSDNVFNGTTWDDNANPAGQVPYTNNNGMVTDHLYANNVVATSLTPEEALAAFIGENPNGTWTIRIFDDAGADVGSLDNWSLQVRTLPSVPFAIPASASNNTAVAIPDLGTTTSTITVAGAGTQLLDVNALLNITHTFNGDLQITLQSPAGTIVTLTTSNGGSSEDVFAGTLFDDDADPANQVPFPGNTFAASRMVTDHAYTDLVVETPLTPEEALGAFIGENPNGTWTLTLADIAGGDVGTLNSWTLNLTTSACTLPPPPNDQCANAVTINCGQTINGTSVNATPDAAPTCTVTTNPGVWYTFTGVGAIETLSTCSAASFDTRISVYRGTCAALICVAGNDDFCGNRSEVSFPTTAGTTYFVLVHGTGGATGTFSLTRTCPPPCTGVPSPGAITPSTTSVCIGTPVVLTVSGYTNVTGLAFQWREATTPGGTYTNIPGATGLTYSFNAAATRYYVCTVTCTNPGGGAATTAEVVVNVGNVQHSAIAATPSTVCSPGTTVITATATGGLGNYTHTLAGPGTIGAPVVSGANNQNVSFTVTNIAAGSHLYTLTSTDGIGCIKASTVSVTVNQTPIISLTTVPPGPLFTNYTVTSSAGNTIVPGTTFVAGSQGDDLTVAIPLPFTYYAYGVGYTALRASTNGNLQFSGAGNAVFTNTCPLPTTTNLGFPSFMPQWDDLRTDQNAGDGIFTSVSGVAPNRIFNIEWRGSLFGFGGSTVNFEARLYEAEQRVDFIYGTNTNNGSSASIGIQGAAAPTTLFNQFSCNAASLSSGLMVSYVAPSVSICEGDIVRIDASAVPPAGQTFTASTNTHIPAGGTTTGIASPYPNTLNVSGLATSGISVKSVTINGYSHTFPDDVDLVLVSPTGQSVILMSDAGGSPDATGQNFVFDDAAASTLADGAFNASGTYRPTNFGAGDNWPAPGPLGAPSATTLSTFTGNMNGNWNLYAFDDVSGDVGFIATWAITFNVPQQVSFSPLTNLFTDAAATIAYTGGPAYTVWARPVPAPRTATYVATSTIAGCTNTATVNITVNQRPVITTQPAAPAAPVCPGFNTTITVGASATNIAYQWQRSTDNGTTWVNVAEDALHSGTTTASITIINPQIPQNGHRYRVIVSGTCTPPVTSNSVTLVIATPPTITTQPANRVVCTPDAAVFTVVANGIPAPNIYQWQVSTTGAGGPWINLTTGGSYTPTLTVSPTATSQTGNLYRVIVTNNCGQSVTSNNASLTVNAPTPVTIAPLPSRICISDTLVNLSATPAGGSWSGIGVSGFNFVPPATSIGTYTLTYTYVNAVGCTSTGTVAAQVIDCPERIRQLDDNAVIVFPNPNNGRFNIRINSVLYNFLGMNVYNVAGQLLHRQSFGGLTYGRVVPIDLSHLPSGTYMVKFFYDDGIRTNEKTFPVVIQRN